MIPVPPLCCPWHLSPRRSCCTCQDGCCTGRKKIGWFSKKRVREPFCHIPYCSFHKKKLGNLSAIFHIVVVKNKSLGTFLPYSILCFSKITFPPNPLPPAPQPSDALHDHICCPPITWRIILSPTFNLENISSCLRKWLTGPPLLLAVEVGLVGRKVKVRMNRQDI